MRLASRKAISVGDQRRYDLQLQRQRAVALRELYPAVAQLQISLVFGDGSDRVPSPQSYTYFPSARAFFRFPCPCAECDGDFDLRDLVAALLAEPALARRRAARTAAGRLSCTGVRLRGRTDSRPCAMTVEYQISAGHAVSA